MKAKITALALVLSAYALSAQDNPRWEFYEIDGPSLENNIIEENTQREIGVYLPPGYFESGKKYPVVYYLMGYNSRGLDPFRTIKKKQFDLIEAKIQNGQVGELIVVFIAGSNRYRGSFYYNSPVTGNWGDFVTQDVVAHIDRKYRTLPIAESRVLVGSSMGGYGALNLSMLHPDIYCGGYGISPGAYKDNGFSDSQILNRKGNLENTLKIVEKFSSMPEEIAHKEFLHFLDTTKNGTLIFSLAYGAAHAPNTSKAPYLNFPISIVENDTIVDQEIWQQWQNGFGGIDWEIERNQKNLKKLKLYGIACGYNEGNIWLSEGCFYMAEKLAEHKIDFDFYMHKGTHTSHTVPVFLDHVLPLMSSVMVHE